MLSLNRNGNKCYLLFYCRSFLQKHLGILGLRMDFKLGSPVSLHPLICPIDVFGSKYHNNLGKENMQVFICLHLPWYLPRGNFHWWLQSNHSHQQKMANKITASSLIHDDIPDTLQIVASNSLALSATANFWNGKQGRIQLILTGRGKYNHSQSPFLRMDLLVENMFHTKSTMETFAGLVTSFSG